MSTPTPPQLLTHLTVIKNRNPEQKVHKTLGHAKQAVLTKLWYVPGSEATEKRVWGNGQVWYERPKALETDVQVYELKDGEWSLLWDLRRGTLVSELPWKTA